MTGRIERVAEIEAVIKKHCWTTGVYGEGPLASFAHHIIACHENALQAADVAVDMPNLDKLARHLRASAELLNGLQSEVMAHLCRTLELTEQELVHHRVGGGQPPLYNGRTLMSERRSSLNSLTEAVAVVQGDFRKRGATTLSKIEALRAAVVMDGCIKVWCEYFERAPNNIHHNSPGPFARFSRDIFEVLNINVAVASAHSKLKKMQADPSSRQLLFSVEHR